MKHYGVHRILTIGTAGILQSRTEPEKYRFQSNESKRKTTRAAEDHLKGYLHLKESDLNWTVICPTYLPDGEVTGTYRVEKIFCQQMPLKFQREIPLTLPTMKYGLKIPKMPRWNCLLKNQENFSFSKRKVLHPKIPIIANPPRTKPPI